MTYTEACAQHATLQGLDLVTDALRSAGLRPHVVQTGGYCMVVEVLGEGRRVWVSNEDGFDVGIYCEQEWCEGISSFLDLDVELQEIADIVKQGLVWRDACRCQVQA